MHQNTSEWDLLRRAQENDQEALARLFSEHRQRLRNMVKLRLNQRLQGRVDASDVVQDAFLEASRVLHEYLKQPAMPFYLWLRHLTGQKLIEIHRRHLDAKKRDAGCEVGLQGQGMPNASTESMVVQLLGRIPTASVITQRAETKAKLEEILGTMDETDREVLVLRHFEHLNNSETAQVLGIEKSAASKRYIRALERLQNIVGTSESEF